MKVEGAKTLVVGDRLKWTPDGALGTVREISYAAIKIQWDDDKWSLMPFADHTAPWTHLEYVTKG